MLPASALIITNGVMSNYNPALPMNFGYVLGVLFKVINNDSRFSLPYFFVTAFESATGSGKLNN